MLFSATSRFDWLLKLFALKAQHDTCDNKNNKNRWSRLHVIGTPVAQKQEAPWCDVTHVERFNTAKKFLVIQKTSDLHNTQIHTHPLVVVTLSLSQSVRQQRKVVGGRPGGVGEELLPFRISRKVTKQILI